MMQLFQSTRWYGFNAILIVELHLLNSVKKKKKMSFYTFTYFYTTDKIEFSLSNNVKSIN